MKSFLKILFFLIIIFFLNSCDTNRVFEEYKSLKKSTWSRFDNAKFDVRITDTKSPHNVIINVRNEGNYKSSNLYLFVTISSPNGNSVKDTVELFLADEHGKWYGSGIGDIFSHQILYKNFIYFPDTGIYTFELEQAMRTEELEHISDIGIRIETAN